LRAEVPASAALVVALIAPVGAERIIARPEVRVISAVEVVTRATLPESAFTVAPVGPYAVTVAVVDSIVASPLDETVATPPVAVAVKSVLAVRPRVVAVDAMETLFAFWTSAPPVAVTSISPPFGAVIDTVAVPAVEPVPVTSVREVEERVADPAVASRMRLDAAAICVVALATSKAASAVTTISFADPATVVILTSPAVDWRVTPV